MKASELRIGNYLQFNPITVTSIGVYSNGISKITPLGIHNIDTGVLKPTPITLTEEWLEKFGFVNEYGDGVGTFYENEKFGVRKIDGIFEDYYYGIKIQYVHQLQNFYFALTGEELN